MDVDQETMEPTRLPPDPLTITIVYDNTPFDQRLKTAWGFSALVEYHERTLLFDTGGNGPTLLENMRILEIDPGKIESVVLSHAHSDHTGGLNALLKDGTQPAVFMPPSFPASFKRQVSDLTEVTEVVPGQSISSDIFTTGEMGRDIHEQALVIKTERGLVIITGCAHPGIVKIVERARALFDEPVYLVMGGFHLDGKSRAEIEAILRDFRRLGVERVAPSHCTGEQAIAMFAAEYGENFLKVGVGSVIRMDGEDEQTH